MYLWFYFLGAMLKYDLTRQKVCGRVRVRAYWDAETWYNCRALLLSFKMNRYICKQGLPGLSVWTGTFQFCLSTVNMMLILAGGKGQSFFKIKSADNLIKEKFPPCVPERNVSTQGTEIGFPLVLNCKDFIKWVNKGSGCEEMSQSMEVEVRSEI